MTPKFQVVNIASVTLKATKLGARPKFTASKDPTATDVLPSSTGMTSDRPPAISWPFHMHPAECPLSPQKMSPQT